MSTHARRTTAALITIITLVASLITIYEFSYNTSMRQTAPPTVSSLLSISPTPQSIPFDFTIFSYSAYGYYITPGVTTVTLYTNQEQVRIGFCPSDNGKDLERSVRMGIKILSGNPEQVRLACQSLPPGIAYVSFSITYATPPFDFDLTIYANNPSTWVYGTYYLIVVAQSDAVSHTYPIALTFYSYCQAV